MGSAVQAVRTLFLLLIRQSLELFDVFVASAEVLGEILVAERELDPRRGPRLGQDLRVLDRELILEIMN